MTRRLRNICGILGITALAPVMGCGGDGSTSDGTGESNTELHGTELVVGSTLDEIGLLVLSSDGGEAVWRSLRDPRQPAWKSSVELPAFQEAHSVAGGSVVLLQNNGEVSRFVPGVESLDELGRMKGEAARWVTSDQGGVFVDTASGEIFAVLPDGAWRFEVGKEVEWAGAVDEGIAALLPDRTLWLVPTGAEEPAAEASLGVRSPGFITAWGRRLAFVKAEDDRTVRLLTVDPPETAGDVQLDGRITALSASPSTHQLYAGLADPPGIAIVNRFSFTKELLTRLDRAPVELRPSLFGDFLLVFDGAEIRRVNLRTGEAVPIPGEWSSDLPLGLQDGAVLTRQGAEVFLVDAVGRTATDPLEAAEAAVWLPVRWTPLATVAVEELEGRPIAVSPGRAAGSTGTPEDQDASRAGRDAGDADDDPAEATAVADPGIPPGFYSIVGSARQRDGIEALVDDLGNGGFPVQVQTTTDEAGETWYRGLVGPFRTRAEAEAASRQLQRERQLQSWVMGIGADG